MSTFVPSLNIALGQGVLMLLLGLWTNLAWAEKAQFAYDLSLSGSRQLLEAGGSSISTSSLPGDLINKQNNPWLKLTNSSKDATLNKFVMSVGDDDFYFSSFTIGNQVGTFDVDVNIIDGGKNLELVFANFNPGETIYVRFQLRPDDASAYQFPDFRNVLFDANGTSVADNSVLTAVFNDPVTKQDETLNGQLPDFNSTAGNMPTGCPRCMCFPLNGGTIDAFRFSQQGNLVPPPIPEPASWLLALIGLASITAGYWHRKLGCR